MNEWKGVAMQTERQTHEISAAALEKHPGAQRGACLTALCQGDTELRQQVEFRSTGMAARNLTTCPSSLIRPQVMTTSGLGNARLRTTEGG